MPRSLTVVVLGLGGVLLGGGCAQIIGIEDRSTCDEGQSLCSWECVNTKTDRRHCGQCGRACGDGTCENGSCVGGALDAGLDAPAVDGAADAAALDAARQDGPRDGQALDGGACQWVDRDCSKELDACTIPGDCNGLACVDTPLWGKRCLRTCACAAQCPFDMFCLPTAATAYATGFSEYATMGGHCFFSVCGAAPTKAWNNGVLRGACAAGGEGYLKPGAVTARPGTCSAIDDVDNYGQCLPGGGVPRGGTCTFSGAPCPRRADYLGCGVGNYCIGTSGAATGTCHKACDPTGASFNPAVPGTCAADTQVTHDQFCWDRSTYDRISATSIRTARDGWCVDTKGCDVLAAADACAGTGTVCRLDNPVSSYGLCAGTIGSATAACNATTPCVNGSFCDIPSGTAGACKPLCGHGAKAGTKPCVGGSFCATVFYQPDPTPGSDITDDQTALDWGGCVPIPDGGVPDGA
jgi:hypothetical protein